MNHTVSLLLLLTLVHGQVSDSRWHGNVCGTSSRRTLTGASFQKCMISCARRIYCFAISYNRKFQRCTLHDNADIQSDCVGHVYVMKQDFDQDVKDVCGSRVCLPDQFCGERSCKYRECQPISLIPNSIVHGNTLNIGAKVKYECTATGDVTTVTCQSDGQWSTLPACLVDCGNPPTFPNTAVSSGNTTEGSSRHYSCLAGYMMNTGYDVSTTCQANGQWTQATFQCIIGCGDPETFPNALVSDGNTGEGSIRHYMCVIGYVMIGSDVTITCQANGQWTQAVFQCITPLADCGEPPTYLNTVINNGQTTAGSTRQYTCTPGYAMSTGSNVIVTTCQSNSQWDHGAVLCLIDCGQPPTYPNTVINNGQTTVGSTRQYTCTAGYVMSTGSNVIVTTCQSNNQWDHGDVQCLIDCGQPPTYPNTVINNGQTTVGSTRQYTCTAGYVLSTGSNVIVTTCQSNSQWDHGDVQCLIDCGEPPIYPNTVLSSGSTLEDSTREYTCVQDHLVSTGENVINTKCMANGLWKHVDFRCLLDTSMWPYTGTCSVTETGRTCQRWDSDTPHHSSSYYTDPSLFPENTVQAAENYCRDPDFSDFQWCLTTDPALEWEECATHLCEFNCASPYVYPNSKVNNGERRQGSERRYTCLAGYVISTGSTVIIATCQANGEWGHVDFQCLPQ